MSSAEIPEAPFIRCSAVSSSPFPLCHQEVNPHLMAPAEPCGRLPGREEHAEALSEAPLLEGASAPAALQSRRAGPVGKAWSWLQGSVGPESMWDLLLLDLGSD